MSFRGFLIILAVVGALLYHAGKPQQWWRDMMRAAEHINAVPAADSMP